LNFETAVGKIRESLDYTGVSNYFLNRKPNAQEIIAKIDKSDYSKGKMFTNQKKQFKESIDNLQNGKKSLPGTQPIKD
jgi:hypothetical protein